MKFILFISISLVIFFQGYSQINKTDTPLPEFKTYEIKLGSPDIKLPVKTVSNFIVIDARADTTSLGFYKSGSDKNYSFVTELSCANEISVFLKDYLQIPKMIDTAGINIIMVLKKLWLTNELSEESNDKLNKKNANSAWLKGLKAKFEFYYGSGNVYTPFYRFDTSYSDTKNITDYAKEYICDVLQMSVQKLITTEFNNISTTRKKMSLQDIISYSNKQFDIPITNSSSYKKGVYATFEEFKTNNPSLINYELKKDKLTQTIFAKDESGEYPVRNAWGFCDGNDIYINGADNYFKLIKKQNTFISFAAKDLSRTRFVKIGNVLMFGVIGGGIGKGNKNVSYSLNHKFYELDMDDGELY